MKQIIIMMGACSLVLFTAYFTLTGNDEPQQTQTEQQPQTNTVLVAEQTKTATKTTQTVSGSFGITVGN